MKEASLCCEQQCQLTDSKKADLRLRVLTSEIIIMPYKMLINECHCAAPTPCSLFFFFFFFFFLCSVPIRVRGRLILEKDYATMN